MLGLCEAETLAILGVCFFVLFYQRENGEGTESAEFLF
jgi:hypothetical protein